MQVIPRAVTIVWLYTAAYVAYALLMLVGALERGLQNDVLSLPVYFAPGASLFVAGRRSADPRTGRGLMVLGFAWALPGGSYVLSLLPGWEAIPALRTFVWVIYRAYYPLSIVALAGLATLPRDRGRGAASVIDGLLVVTASATLQWYVVARMRSADATTASIARSLGWIFVAELLIVFGAAVLAYRPRKEGEWPWAHWLGVGMFVACVSDFVYEHRKLTTEVWPNALGDIVFAIAGATVATAALHFDRRATRVAGRGAAAWSRGLMLFPYIATALVAWAIALEYGRGAMSEIATGLVAGGGGLMAMLVAHHAVAQRELVVAQRKQATLDARYRALVQHSTDAFVIADAQGGVTYASPAFADLIAADATDIHLNRVVIGEAPDLPREAERGAPQRWRVGQPGAARDVDAVVTNLLQDPAVGGFVINLRDVTERVRLEQQLRDAQKLEVVGRLASTVAHDFNNLLTVVLGNASLAAHESADSTRPLWLEVRGAAERGAALVRQLLSLGRPVRGSPRVIDLGTELRRLETTLRSVLPSTVDVRIDVPTAPVPVCMDVVQLEQIVLNLALNSRDAMGSRGRLTIDLTTESAAPLAVLQVADTGIGMDAATLARAFEPFFTTKSEHHGTGLGLFTVRQSVEELGGDVTATSTPGGGTTLSLRIPLARLEAPPHDETALPASTTESGGGHVLIVEDEPSVRNVISRALTAAGFTVSQATDGVDALERLDALRWRVDAVLTDLVMPRMSGDLLVRRIREQQRDLPVLCMSGNGLPASDTETARLLSGPVLQKPVAPGDLIRELAAVVSPRKVP